MTKKRIKVLLADDDKIYREGLRRILETADDITVVAEAESAHETQRLTLEFAPEILIMDLKWGPDETAGWAAIKEIKTSSPRTRILAITAYEKLVTDARTAGADAAIEKATFSAEILLRLIQELAHRIESFPNLAQKSTSVDRLTDRERQVLLLLGKGMPDKEIGEILGISTNTASNHVRKILSKLAARSRTEAVALAQKLGFFK